MAHRKMLTCSMRFAQSLAIPAFDEKMPRELTPSGPLPDDSMSKTGASPPPVEDVKNETSFNW